MIGRRLGGRPLGGLGIREMGTRGRGPGGAADPHPGDNLLLSGDMANDANDNLSLSGDMTDGNDALLLSGTF